MGGRHVCEDRNHLSWIVAGLGMGNMRDGWLKRWMEGWMEEGRERAGGGGVGGALGLG